MDKKWNKPVDIEAHDAQGYCALHYACGEGHSNIAKYLITECKASLDSRNNDGLTPIMCAVQQVCVGGWGVGGGGDKGAYGRLTAICGHKPVA